MNRLPYEVLLLIFEYIPPRQLLKFLRVNRTFNDVISLNSKRLPKQTVTVVVHPFDLKSKMIRDGIIEQKDADIYITSNRDSYVVDFPEDIIENIVIHSNGISFCDCASEKLDCELVQRPEFVRLVASKFGCKIERRDYDFFLALDDVRAAYCYIFQLIAEKFNVYELQVHFPKYMVQVREDIFAALQRAGTVVENLTIRWEMMSHEQLFHYHHVLGTKLFDCAPEGFVDDLFPFQDRFGVRGGVLRDFENLRKLLEKWETGALNTVNTSFIVRNFSEFAEVVDRCGAKRVDVRSLGNFITKGNIHFELSRKSDNLKLWIWFRNSDQLGSVVNFDNDKYR